jgi:hypothetical protein
MSKDKTVKKTHIVMVLDRSGSMAGLETDIAGGFHAFIEDQKTIKGKCKVSLSKFDTVYEEVFNKLKLEDVPPLVLEPRGATALYDAVGKTFSSVVQGKNERIVGVVMTDGFENASKEWNSTTLAKLLEDKKDQGWEIIFLGTTEDAALKARALGFAGAAVMDSADYKKNYKTVSSSLSTARLTGEPVNLSSDDFK